MVPRSRGHQTACQPNSFHEALCSRAFRCTHIDGSAASRQRRETQEAVGCQLRHAKSGSCNDPRGEKVSCRLATYLWKRRCSNIMSPSVRYFPSPLKSYVQMHNVLAFPPHPFSTNMPDLIVTTPSRVCKYNINGITTLFTSSRNGIAASAACSDLLAVADSQVVVLHDGRRAASRSWGLGGDSDQVRLLASTGTEIYMTTKLSADIVCYKPSQDTVESQMRGLPGTPLAMACSRRFLVCTTDGPPAVYLRHVRDKRPPIRFQPLASRTAAHIVVFHPDDDCKFLLGFGDGTIAAYNARRVDEVGDDGEAAHMLETHRTMTASCFVPGYKALVVTAGGDGRCRMSNLEGSATLRVWRARSSLTSVAATKSIIAVGRTDGLAFLYSLTGLQLRQLDFGPGRVISLVWQSVERSPETSRKASVTAFARRRSELQRPASKRTLRTDAKFTVHPDEIDGTVIRRPPAIPHSFEPVPTANRPDLFPPPPSSPKEQRRPKISPWTFKRPHARHGLGKQKAWHPGNVLERESTWPTDSFISDQEAEEDEDAWESAHDTAVESEGGYHQDGSQPLISGALVSPIGPAPPPQQLVPPPRIDGSTDEYVTAKTHLSPSGFLSPGSDDVRALFPRRSSLSPIRERRRSHKSPFSRDKPTKRSNLAPSYAGLSERLAPTASIHGRDDCTEAQGRQDPLHSEVVRAARTNPWGREKPAKDVNARVIALEAEVATLRATLKRNGIS